MFSKRIILLFAVLSLLGGCLHAQLNGSVSGAIITVTELRNPGVVVLSTSSFDESDSIAAVGQEE